MTDLNDTPHVSSMRGDRASSPLMDMVGIRLRDRYEIVSRIALSLYSEIFIATDCAAQNESQKNVIVKALNLGLNGPLDSDLERTLIENMATEVAALQRLHHPNIIQLIGCGNDLDLNSRSYFYILLEYMKGGDLAGLCLNQPLRVERALFYVKQIRDALSYAHSSGVIHRDIKPQNLLLSGDRKVVKLSDFGTCRLDRLTGAITQVGTADYSPPEHFSRADETSALTPASDVYSLAKTFWFFIGGRPPSRFSQREISELPETLRNHPRRKGILEALRKATRDQPQLRHQTVNDFWDDLCDSIGDCATMRLSDASHSMSARKPLVIEIGVTPRTAEPRHEGNIRQRNLNRRETFRDSVAQYARLRNQFLRISSSGSRAFQSLIVPVTIVVLTLALLFGSYQFISIRLRASAKANLKKNDAGLASRNGTLIRNANIRPSPGTDNAPIGLAESGSRVRILQESVDRQWYEVMVSPIANVKADQRDPYRGWLNKKFVTLD